MRPIIFRAIILGMFALMFVPQPASAQGTLQPIVLHTGGGQPLVTSFQQLQIANNSTRELSFEFGFGTDETPLLGQFHDSFTVTVQDAALVNTLVLLTADASGVIWAPTTPGGVVIPADGILRGSIAFPSLQPVLANQSAFAVLVPLPAVFSGPVNVYFDLFDNLDAAPSLGWYRAVFVPEPGAWALWGIGLLLIWVGKRSRH